MTRSAWAVVAVVVAAQVALLTLFAWATWNGLAAEQRQQTMALLQQAGTLPLLGAVALLGLTVLLVRVIFTRWVAPLRALAEDARLIAMSNPRHRAPVGGAAEVRELTGAVNLLAERFQGLHADVETRIREANALIEEEKNTLAALMSKLTQGVLVCNPEGRILLYNPRAQQLLEGQVRQSGVGDWIGLGRSVFGVVDPEGHTPVRRCPRLVVGDRVVGYEWFCDREVHQDGAWGYRIAIPGGFIYAYDAYIDPAYRNTGVWLRFKAYLGDLMVASGKRGVLTFVDYGNLPSLRTHLRFGFKPATTVLAMNVLGWLMTLNIDLL